MTKSSHAVLVLGSGSIGRRHLRNLCAAFPLFRVAAYDPSPSALAGAPQDVERFDDPAAAWAWRPDVVFVCSPTSEHLASARESIERGCHVFVEKPLSHTDEGLADFVALTGTRPVVVQVGANMRYHPGPKTLKRLLDEGAIGRLVSVSTLYGGYLPDWHPGEDYRLAYSARAALGGGVLLDAIHEIDMALWFVGQPDFVTGCLSRTGALEIETEDVARVLIRSVDGAIADVRLDYLQRPPQRAYSLVGTDGRLDWEVRWPHISRSHRDGSTEQIGLDTRALNDSNVPYVDQLKDFIACVDSGSRPAVGAAEGALAVTVALAAKRASGSFARVEC